MLTDTKPTPGPWVAVGGSVETEGETLIVMPDPCCHDDDLMIANANLIAATPDLLAVARNAAGRELEDCEDCSGTGLEPGNPDDACRRCGGVGEVVLSDMLPEDVRAAREAVAKTRGTE